MDEKELRTSPKQRVFIILIAVLMVGSIVASYAAIVISGSQGATSGENQLDKEKIAKYTEAYEKVQDEFKEYTKSDYDEFVKYRSEIKAYNEASANDSGLQKRDLKEGDGKTIASGDTEYLAYYVGWCADESVFDSSFDDNENPEGFSKILDASLGMIEGWNLGVEGMKINGVREITIPGELAYGDSREICGGKNKPLKFLIMAKEKSGSLKDMSDKLDEAATRLQYAYYGIDYDTVNKNEE